VPLGALQQLALTLGYEGGGKFRVEIHRTPSVALASPAINGQTMKASCSATSRSRHIACPVAVDTPLTGC
jgi:hypothetical protein